ncbi:MAG: AgmX/PglI C-terminal domain-containing protein [Deltaproteobacteria bacterium]|nr:AgmX/PglI C-terminal domain-containing protein [Deltaproteobacteria bacterium]
MRLAAVLVLIAACEKQGPVESTPGLSSTSGTATPVIKAVDAGVATIGTDAVAPASADAAVAVVTPDAAVRRGVTPPDVGRRRDDVGMSDENAARIADLLTADFDKDQGQGAMNRRPPTADLGQQGGAGGGRGTRGDGDARIGTGRGQSPKVDGPGSGSASDTPSGRISIADKRAFDDTSLSVDMVLMKVQSAYMAGVKRCYKTQLKQDPSMRGKVKLGITVNESGRSVGAKASGFSTAIDDCLKGLMQLWNFPVPKDKDGETTGAGFEITLQLVPD